ncbi:beta strand repeat-containing protein, partial [Gluconacetobacter sacchari]|uniref:beta strand repeat-containing protein n=1 Tax=Gluconacetobacter sacchari TaxID=92759 RepID=UPI00222F7201
ARANLYGNGNTISLNTGSAIGVFGTNNAITATGNATRIYLDAPGTANSLNTVTASNLANATATDGEAAGLYLDGGARANLYGNSNTISLNAGSAIGVFGTNNAITATGNAHVYLNAPGTANSLNTVTASNLANATATDGEAAGLYLDGGARANLYGNSNTISLNTGSAIGVFGTNNAITATGNATHVYLDAPGTANSLNTVTASNLANATATDGEAAGLYLDGGARANLYGNGNTIGLNTGSAIGVFGTNNAITATGNATRIYLDAPGAPNSLNTVTASNLANATATDGEAAGLYLDGGARANLYGNGNTIGLNAGSAIGVFGTNNAITATGNATRI